MLPRADRGRGDPSLPDGPDRGSMVVDMALRYQSSEGRSESTIQQILNAPFGKMVENFALAIQSAQQAIDAYSLRIMDRMSDRDQGLELEDGRKLSMLELGLTPAFYHFRQATVEVRLSMSIRRFSGTTAYAGAKDPTAPFKALADPGATAAGGVDPATAAKYSYPPGDSCLVRAKIDALPAPATLSARLRQKRKKR